MSFFELLFCVLFERFSPLMFQFMESLHPKDDVAIKN